MTTFVGRHRRGVPSLVCLAGCSAFRPELEVPRLTLVSVAMTSADIFNQQFVVR